MAKRPIYMPTKEKPGIRVVMVDFDWHPGLSRTQKQKCIESLHAAAAEKIGIGRILEISTKSTMKIGQDLSAFELRLRSNKDYRLTVEAAFQGSKVFRQGGPYTDLYTASPRDAKRDSRLANSGPLTGFFYSGQLWPLEPKTLFYDWIYLSALCQNPQMADHLLPYDGFTDIEFNPVKSFNCQARSAALYVHLKKRGVLDSAMESPDAFKNYIAISNSSENSSGDQNKKGQLGLF